MRTALTYSPASIFSKHSCQSLSGGNVTDHRVELDLAGNDHRNDALPNRPVVREAAGESDVLLDERIETELYGLRPPSHLDDLTSGANCSQSHLQSDGSARAIDGDIDAEAVSHLSDVFEHAAIKRYIRAKLASDREAMRIGGKPGDDEMARAAQLCHFCAKQADGSGAEDQDRIAWADAAIHANSVVGDAAGLRKSCFFERKIRRKAMEAALGYAHILRHGAIDAISEAAARRIEVVQYRSG